MNGTDPGDIGPRERECADEFFGVGFGKAKKSNGSIWDGTESELVLEEDAREYEGEVTGIKISYRLKHCEVEEFLKYSDFYKRSSKKQTRAFIAEGIVLLFLFVQFLVTRDVLCLWLMFVPLLALLGVWIAPKMILRNISEKLYAGDKYDVEVFPDKIEVICNGVVKKEFPFDGSIRSEVNQTYIAVCSKTGEALVIPIRAIEPDFLFDVQAMIIAGTRSLRKV
jgi:hypothetical protein